MSRPFDFDSRADDRPRFRARRVGETVREPEPLVEITAGDVWTAVKQGFGMGFFIGIVAGLLVAFTGERGGFDSDRKYFHTIVVCLVLIPMVWVPLAVGARATSRRRDFTAGLLKFACGLFVFAYVLSVIAVMCLMLYARAAKLGR